MIHFAKDSDISHLIMDILCSMAITSSLRISFRRGVSVQFVGFVEQSRAFKANYNGNKAIFNNAEYRILKLYEWLQIGIKPWEWDYERYGERNKDMIGFFYMDDLMNIEMLGDLERAYKAKTAKGGNTLQ